MKKAILTFVIAFAGIITANAQVWLGGSLSFNTNKAEGQRGTYLFLGPEVGYSFGDWSVAMALGYANSTSAALAGPTNKYTTSALQVSPYIRYNVCNIEKFSFFLDGAFDFIGWRDKYNINGTITYGRDWQTTWQAGIKPGIAFHPTAKWAAVFHCGFIGYSKGSIGGIDNIISPYDPGFNIDFTASTISVGFYYNF